MKLRFSRKEFFDLMWSKPIKDLAPEFGISDVALAKFCRKHDFPLPGRGYWAKLNAGQPIESPSLAPRGLGKHETISIGRDEWRGREAEDARVMAEEIPPPPEFPEALDSLRGRVAKLVGQVAFIKGLDRPHRAIAVLLDEDKKRLEKRNASSFHSIFDEPFFASPYERRRLKLMCLRLANDLREYVHATRIANKAAPNPVPDEEVEEWASWALIQSDRIDPVLTRSFMKPVEDPGEGLTRGEDTQPASRLSDFAVTEPAWHPNRWYPRLHR